MERITQTSAASSADARQQAIARHLGLVQFVARQIANASTADVEFDELVSAGTLGLMSALEHFDPSRGLAFSTFAAPRIRGAILDELRRLDHVPRSVRRKARDINGARDALATKLRRQPTDRELAAHLNVDLDTLWRWRGDVEGAVQVSLDRSVRRDDETAPTPGEQLASAVEDNVEERIGTEQEVARLRESIARLKDQERIVLTLSYFEELKLHEIATILGLTESRVSQIRTKALARLRSELAPLREHVA
ncbi:MAG: FliA/WhiG family RNA polymerase sigma factor [Gemmatimonadetes bacterium]|nr:FliA/WhiG family RNA polymerase sigma factor [Gemmatimonadota bacterium]